MYSTQMRRHKIIRVLLILFIVNQVVNFVFGAPVAIREERSNADITEGGAAALQKRVNPVEGSTNMAGQMPPSLDNTEAGELGMGPRPLRIPASPTSPSSDLHQSSTGSTDSNSMPRTPPSPRTPPYHLGHPLVVRMRPQPLPPAPLPPDQIRPTRPTGPPLQPISFLRPFPSHRPFRPYNPPFRTPLPIRPYVPLLSYNPYHPPISPPILPGDRLQPVSSLPTDKQSMLIPQQNSAGPDLDVHPPNPEPHPLPSTEQPSTNPLSNLEQPAPNQPHPSAAEMPIDEVLDMLKKTKLKRALPAPVQ